jgi:hypothetical protein
MPDWTIVQVAAGPGLGDLNLTFYDSAGRAISGQALPGSAEAFSEFPDVVLYAVGTNGSFGQYVLDVAITEVPEPAMPLLSCLGLGLLGGFCLRRRSPQVWVRRPPNNNAYNGGEGRAFG